MERKGKEKRGDCLLFQYADDTQFITSDKIENLQELMKKTEDTLKIVKIYFNKNCLLLNSKKTQCMFIGNRNRLSRIPSNTVIRVKIISFNLVNMFRI